MNFRNLLVGAFAIVALAGCSGGNDSSGNGRATAAAETPAEEAGTYRQGTANYSFAVTDRTLMVDGAEVDGDTAGTFEGYPMLAAHVAELNGSDKAVETKEQALELFANDSLHMAIDLRSESHDILWSRNNFSAERIAYSRSESEQGQGLANGSVTFELRECKVEEKEQEQGQEQEQGKGEEKIVEEKGQEQEQEQGQEKLAEEKGQEQGQEQTKGEDKVVDEKGEDKIAETCMVAMVTLNLEEVAAPKEQEQGKGEDKVADEKGEDKGQEQEQGKGEDKVADEKGQEQEQGQDQSKS